MLETFIFLFKLNRALELFFQDLCGSIATNIFWFVITNPEISLTLHMFLVTLYHKKYAYGFFMWMFFLLGTQSVRCVWIFLTYDSTDAFVYLSLSIFCCLCQNWLLDELLRKHRIPDRGNVQKCIIHETVRAFWYSKHFIFEYREDDEYMAEFQITLHEFLSVESNCIYVNSHFKREIVEFFMPTTNFRIFYRDIGKECCICQSKFQFGSLATRRFYCTHVLHKECCDRWLDINPLGKCPLCRSEHNQFW